MTFVQEKEHVCRIMVTCVSSDVIITTNESSSNAESNGDIPIRVITTNSPRCAKSHSSSSNGGKKVEERYRRIIYVIVRGRESRGACQVSALPTVTSPRHPHDAYHHRVRNTPDEM